jgi:ADP-heptose:LPS heptosyltransferase
MPATTPSQTRHILLITLSNIGDGVLTTPVLQALHARYPEAVVDIVTDARASELFTHCPWRGAIVLKHKQLGWRGTLALVRQLRARRYDLVVDLRTDGLTLFLRARRRLTRRSSRPLGWHAVERHFGVIREEGYPDTIPPVGIWLSDSERDYAEQLLAGLPGQRWLALGPGARWPDKRWPADHFAALATQLQPYFDAAILLGTEAEQDCCTQIESRLTLPCMNLAGRTDLLQASAVLQQARLFIGNDSGLGHLAAAAGTPTVTVFGPGDPLRYHPWHPQARWLQSPTGAIADVSVESVHKQALELLTECQVTDKPLITTEPTEGNGNNP